MFERFTEKARRVIFFARYEASQYGSQTIETEHLLLGLLREDHALSRKFLGQKGGVQFLREEIESQIKRGERISTSVELPLSAECKRIFNMASEEAAHLGSKHIGTEHLLLGILREDDCLAARLLRDRRLTLDALLSFPPEFFGHTQFQIVHHRGGRSLRRFAHQQMNVFRHHHITKQAESRFPPHALQLPHKNLPCMNGFEKGSPLVTAEG